MAAGLPDTTREKANKAAGNTTAVPVLHRILQDTRMDRTELIRVSATDADLLNSTQIFQTVLPIVGSNPILGKNMSATDTQETLATFAL